MTRSKLLFATAIALLFITVPMVQAESDPANADPAATTQTAAQVDPSAQTPGIFEKQPCPTPKMQNFRPTNQCGLNMFETPKEDAEAIPFEGFKIDWGAGFSQTYQSLKHRNTSSIRGLSSNQLLHIGRGFNLANANLYLNGQLSDGVRVSLVTYLSSRHHNEAWVKDGYIQMDKLPFKLDFMGGLLNTLFDNLVTVKIGHFEINYGDQHFRRTDNGQGMYNPFIGNYLMDSFTTEIGGEVYIRANGVMVMGSLTGGEIRGNVQTPYKRRPAFITKIGFDRQINPDLRVRLTASNYTSRKSPALTLYAGDRAGSPYFCVMESAATGCGTGQFTSGTINPGFRYSVMAFQVNPFVKYKGLELFGVFETAEGTNEGETRNRTFSQHGGEAVYRFAGDHLYVGMRYNRVSGRLAGFTRDVSVHRAQYVAGWFLNRYLLLKMEYVVQNYKDYPSTSILNGGRFQGTIVDAVLSF